MKTGPPLLRHQSPGGDGAHDDGTKSVRGEYIAIAIRGMPPVCGGGGKTKIPKGTSGMLSPGWHKKK
jgi:hypothetical protein